MSVSIPYQDGQFDLEFGEAFELHQVAPAQLNQASDDWPERLGMALNQPDSSPPLSEILKKIDNVKVTLVLDDIPKCPTARILDVIMKEVRHAGVSDEQIKVIFANTNGKKLSTDEVKRKLGDNFENFAFKCNAPDSAGEHRLVYSSRRLDYHVDNDVADADVRIIVSAVKADLLYGFCGGYETIVPGCCSEKTISKIQRIGLNFGEKKLIGLPPEKNLARIVSDTADKFLNTGEKKTFAVQYILDENFQPSYIAAGNPISTQRMLAKLCAVNCGIVNSPPLSDIVVANAWPGGGNIAATIQSLANSYRACRPDGVIICIAQMDCENIPTWEKYWPLGRSITRRIVSFVGPENIASIVTKLSPNIKGPLPCRIKLALQVLKRNRVFIVCQQLADNNCKLPGAEVFGTFAQALEHSKQYMSPKTKSKVTVFPSALSTYCVKIKNSL